MRIGELAEQTGTSVRSLRYYEDQGLLGSRRSGSGQRHYSPEAAERVRLLRRLYGAGLSSATIRSVLPCVDSPSDDVTDEVVAIMQGEHTRIGAQIDQLTATRAELAHLIDAASSHRAGRTAEPACAAGHAV